MSLTNLLVQLQNEALRERALCGLSALLLEKKQTDRLFYCNTGRMLYFSPSTTAILLQEMRVICTMIENNSLTTRICNRCMNVLTIFQSLALCQCIVSHPDTRDRFVAGFIPNWLLPLITHASRVDVFENVRAVSLSIFWVLCEDQRPCIIKWVIDNNFANALKFVLDIGNELSKAISLSLIERLLRRGAGLHYICSGQNNCHLLASIIKIWDDLIHRISSGKEFSGRLLLHVLLCVFRLRFHPEGQRFVKEKVQPHLGSLIAVTEAFPHSNRLAKLLQSICDISDRQRVYFPSATSNK